ncbi:MAG: DNA repair protein RecO [Methylobacter sp.]|nr:DNA repair protein RecO [Methylobacter sp.]
MTELSVYLQPAFILQQRKYRETSLIIDVLTRDFGRISLLAKGVRKAKSKTVGLLQPFVPLIISYVGKAELKTLTDVEIIQPFSEIKGLALYCGFYINELVSCFLHKYDPHPEVFGHYKDCLTGLADSSKMEAALRLFELDLMDSVGYGLQLEYDANDKPIDPLKKYAFTAGQGPIESVDGQFSGKTLQAISLREFTDPQVLCEAKILMRTVIDVYLQGKPLKSRTVINKIIKYTKNE